MTAKCAPKATTWPTDSSDKMERHRDRGRKEARPTGSNQWSHYCHGPMRHGYGKMSKSKMVERRAVGSWSSINDGTEWIVSYRPRLERKSKPVSRWRRDTYNFRYPFPERWQFSAGCECDCRAPSRRWRHLVSGQSSTDGRSDTRRRIPAELDSEKKEKKSNTIRFFF